TTELDEDREGVDSTDECAGVDRGVRGCSRGDAAYRRRGPDAARPCRYCCARIRTDRRSAVVLVGGQGRHLGGGRNRRRTTAGSASVRRISVELDRAIGVAGSTAKTKEAKGDGAP